ncbi:MAG: hypothetical protein ACTTJC_05760 [Campylobacter sp.]
MAVTPLGNTIFINQNANVVSHKAAEVQNRFDLQSAAAFSITEEERKEVEQIRPTEETYKIDPQNEHQKQKNQQEREKSDNDEQNDESNDAEEQTKETPIHHIDLKI